MHTDLQIISTQEMKMMVVFTWFLLLRDSSLIVCFPVLEKGHMIGVFHFSNCFAGEG